MTRDQLAAHAKAVAAQCPLITDAQRDRIASILRGAMCPPRTIGAAA